MKNKFFLIIFLVLIFNYSCNLKQDPQATTIEAVFNVDSSLLKDVPFVDSALNISLNIPRNWFRMNEEFEKIVKSNFLINDYEKSQLSVGYLNEKDSSIMVLLDVRNIDLATYADLKNNYREILNKDQQWSDVQFQEFEYHSFWIEQYVLQNEHILSFKLVCYDNEAMDSLLPKVELQYIINRQNLTETIKSVESSIGTINHINKIKS